MITAVATRVLVKVLDLESISTAGSVGFLLIFGIVNFVGFRLAGEVGGTRIISLAGCLLSAAALAVLLHEQARSNATGVVISLAIIATCVVAEWLYRRVS